MAPPKDPSPLDKARDVIKRQFPGQPELSAKPSQEARERQGLRKSGTHAAAGYDASHQALSALHSGGLAGLHHHGRQMQEHVKAMVASGAKPEELSHLHKHLTGLSYALQSGDVVKAHEAVLGLQHGFFAAHASMQKEHGEGDFPKHRFETPKGAMSRWQASEARNSPPTPIRPGSALARPDFEKRAADYKKDNPEQFAEDTHQAVLARHGYMRRGATEYMHPKTKHTALIQLGGVTHMSPSGKELGHFGQAGDLDRHLDGVHKSTMSDWDQVKMQADMLEMSVQEYINFKANMAAPTHRDDRVVVNFHTSPISDPGVVAEFKEAAATMKAAATQPIPIDVHVPPPVIHNHHHTKVDPTPVKFEATVQPAPVHVQEAAKPADVHVHVAPTPIQNNVNVEAKPGEVRVVAEVKLPERKPIDIDFKTDSTGKLTGAKGK